MARKYPFQVWGQKVLDEVANRNDPELSEAFATTLELLAEDPYNDPPRAALRVLPYKDASLSEHNYTVAVDSHGLLLYNVKQDYPIIVLKSFIGS